jgi:hypothetical protein
MVKSRQAENGDPGVLLGKLESNLFDTKKNVFVNGMFLYFVCYKIVNFS